MRTVFFVMLLISISIKAQNKEIKEKDSLPNKPFEKGLKKVNKCTPWHHLICVSVTASEVYEDGRAGIATRHWWRMSYIGRACSDQYGIVFGKLFEGFFAIPHYISIAMGNGVGYMVYLVRGSPEKIEQRKFNRTQRRLMRKSKRAK